MDCPYCSKTRTKVIDSRVSDSQVRRRRECLACSHRFTTYERAEMPSFTVIKKDGRREPFSSEKLLRGLQKALEKRHIELSRIKEMAKKIEAALRSKHAKDVESKRIGKAVMNALKRVDKVAYLRFASVYKEFEGLREFSSELKRIGPG